MRELRLRGRPPLRRRLVLASRGPSHAVWEVLGQRGERLARAADLGLPADGTQELEAELRLARVSLDPA